MTRNALNEIISLNFMGANWRPFFGHVKRTCSGVDRKSPSQFQTRLPFELEELRDHVLSGYKPAGLLGIPKPKHGKGTPYRVICVPTVRDRFLQFCVQSYLGNYFKRIGVANKVSFGVVRGRANSVLGAQDQARKYRNAGNWVYKTDITSFFDRIPRQELKERISTAIKHRSLHNILHCIVDCEISRGVGHDWQEAIKLAGIRRGEGIRQGMPLSPFFASLYLRDFDRALIDRGLKAIRYSDDFAIFCSSRQECVGVHKYVSEELAKIGLTVPPVGSNNSKTRIYGPKQRAEFLGLDITPSGPDDYVLEISGGTMAKILKKYDAYLDFNFLQNKNISLLDYGGRLGSMTRGYLSAYQAADNFAQFEALVEAQETVNRKKILESLFGEKAISQLPPEQKRFIGYF